MQLKSWQKILLAAAVAVVPILSCGRRSLVLMDVKVSGTTTFSDATLVIDANDDQKTTFDGVVLNQAGFRAGVYLPSDMTGTVTFKAEVDEGNCIVGTGTVTADVSAGGTTGPIDLIIDPMVPCTPLTDGGGAGGGGGMTGSAGAVGSGGRGAAGSGGTSGAAGSGGGSGSGGGGSGGSAGQAGRGGSGNAGHGGSGGSGGGGISGGHGGSAGSGGPGGGGTGGMGTGKGGIGGMAGSMGNGGSGSGGTGGLATGMAGTGGCVCPLPNEICDAAGACVCSQTDAQACSAAGIRCGSTTNICGQPVTCKCPANSICDATTGTCSITCVTGAGGTIVPLDEEAAAVICPAIN